LFGSWNDEKLVKENYENLPGALFERMTGDSEDFYRHSMGQAATACQTHRQISANLRYSIQIHATLISGLTDRSHFQSLFSCNQVNLHDLLYFT
jgi:hypothetical protein